MFSVNWTLPFTDRLRSTLISYVRYLWRPWLYCHRRLLTMHCNLFFFEIIMWLTLCPSSCFMEDFCIKPILIENSSGQAARWSPVAEETVIKALAVLLNDRNYPTLITCKFGNALTGWYKFIDNDWILMWVSRREGAVIGCVRKLQRWSMVSIFEEYRRFSGLSRIQQQHEQFIE